MNQLAQHSAERGISTGGAPDSPNLNAAYLRSLGLNSLDLQNRGQSQLNSLLGQFQQAAPYNLMSGLVSSEDQQAANAAAGVSAAAPNPRAAADEEQRKLLEAIAAGKASAGGGPAGSGGLDIQKIIDAFNAAHKTNEPGVAVGKGPSQTINTGSPAQNIGQTPLWPNIPSINQYHDPGVAGASTLPGRPNDVVQNAFAPSTYGNYPVQGMGLNPAVNAVTQSLGNTGLQYGGGPTIDNAFADFGAPSQNTPFSYGQGPLADAGDPWGYMGGGNAPNDWLSSSDPWQSLSNIDWLQPDQSTGSSFDDIFGLGNNSEFDYWNPDTWDWGAPSDPFTDYYNPA